MKDYYCDNCGCVTCGCKGEPRVWVLLLDDNNDFTIAKVFATKESAVKEFTVVLDETIKVCKQSVIDFDYVEIECEELNQDSDFDAIREQALKDLSCIHNYNGDSFRFSLEEHTAINPNTTTN